MPVTIHRFRTRATRAKHARGVSIVEALIALIILSVGMLGIASLYLESVRSNRTALVRTNAVFLVNDLADRIRGNRTAKTAYAVTKAAVPPTGTDCAASTNCTPAQLASFDLKRWHDAVLDRLPDGPNGQVPEIEVVYTAGTSGNPDSYVIRTYWYEPGSTTALSTQLEVLILGTA